MDAICAYCTRKKKGRYKIKVIGIVAEYNPFHNGHLYQLRKSKEELGADYVIAVMSGNFVMRGEPALYGKFARAKAAVLSGVDLVIELPVPYALASAEYFAYGAVSILDSLNIVDYLSFGSEAGDIQSLTEIADIMLKKSTMEKIRENSKKGRNLFEAYEEIFSKKHQEILKTPNNILAINYIKALKRLNSPVTPYTVERIKNGYNDITPKEEFASATALRELLKNNEEISSYIPDTAFRVLEDEKPVFEEDFNQSLIYALRIKGKEEYLKYGDTGEGLHNLIKRTADINNNIFDAAMAIKSKRYSYTRIKRILYNIFLDIPGHLRTNKPEYARVLAFNEKGQKLMSEIKNKSDFPVFTNVKKEMTEKFEGLSYDIAAGRIYQLANPDYKERIML